MLDLKKEAAVLKRLWGQRLSFSPYSEFSSGDVRELVLIEGSLSQELASLSEEEIEDIKERSVVVIKNVFPDKGSLAVDMLLQPLFHYDSWARFSLSTTS